MSQSEFFQLDFPALLCATLAALLCSLLGNLLVLRRQSLMGDALAHAVLPGIVISFLVTGSLGVLAVFGGALVAATVAALLIDWIRRYGRVEPGASMGVVFTLMFALGVVLIGRYQAGNVHLEPEHVLFGQLETLFWLEVASWRDLFDLSVWSTLPAEIKLLFLCLLVTVIYISVLYKELKLSAFDSDYTSVAGFSVNLIHYSLMVLVAAGCIVAFAAVGSILVVGLLVCPAATSRLLTDDYRQQMLFSAFIGVITAWSGYLLAALLPALLGLEISFSSSGMIAVVGGCLFLITAWLRPRVQPGSRPGFQPRT